MSTSDATGQYNRYAFPFGSNLNDYPKFGVWPDAYYYSANMFAINRGHSASPEHSPVGAVPEERHAQIMETVIRWNYTTVLNIVFPLLAGLKCGTSGVKMIRMLNQINLCMRTDLP